jgi:hypothetical protein
LKVRQTSFFKVFPADSRNSILLLLKIFNATITGGRRY